MSEPKRIGAIVRREQERLWKSCPGLGLQALWQEAAGPDVAAHTSVKSSRDGVVTISCDSGAWACELKLHAEALAAKINALGPPERVRQIRFSTAAAHRWKYRK